MCAQVCCVFDGMGVHALCLMLEAEVFNISPPSTTPIQIIFQKSEALI